MPYDAHPEQTNIFTCPAELMSKLRRGAIILFFITLYLTWTFFQSTRNVRMINITKERQTLLDCLTRGHWSAKQTISEKDHAEVVDHLTSARVKLDIPRTLQRDDGKCGNVSFGNGLAGSAGDVPFRALCDPHGRTPCCDYTNRCVSSTRCTCRGCSDERRLLHAELAMWRPEHDTCRVKTFSKTSACDFLVDRGITYIAILGDSLVRHLYFALLLILKDDTQWGALRPDISQGKISILGN